MPPSYAPPVLPPKKTRTTALLRKTCTFFFRRATLLKTVLCYADVNTISLFTCFPFRLTRRAFAESKTFSRISPQTASGTVLIKKRKKKRVGDAEMGNAHRWLSTVFPNGLTHCGGRRDIVQQYIIRPFIDPFLNSIAWS